MTVRWAPKCGALHVGIGGTYRFKYCCVRACAAGCTDGLGLGPLVRCLALWVALSRPSLTRRRLLQPTVDFVFNLKFAGLEGLDGFRLGDFNDATLDMDYITMANAEVESGIVIAGLTCTEYCQQLSTCASCMANSQCGWCSSSSSCMYSGDTCDSPLLLSGCCPSCAAHTFCGACLAEPGCGWAYDTGTCHSTTDGVELCGAGSLASWSQFTAADALPTQCRTCPGAVNSTGSAVDPYTHPVASFCSGHGTCAADMSCRCDPGYAGLGCETLCPGAPGDTCSGHGTCDALTGTCLCECGFGGDSCALSGCPCDTDDAHGSGSDSAAVQWCSISDDCSRCGVVWCGVLCWVV